MPTYSFIDTHCAITGPGGVVNLAQGAGAAEEGIDIEATEDINTMIIGADGTAMHSLHANKSGHITVRLQKTSNVNQQLSLMYALQTQSSSSHGQNTITLANTKSGDVITCQQVAFKKAPPLKYGKEAGFNEWTFDAGIIDRTLGGNN
jgi:hypothetical protein